MKAIRFLLYVTVTLSSLDPAIAGDAIKDYVSCVPPKPIKISISREVSHKHNLRPTRDHKVALIRQLLPKVIESDTLRTASNSSSERALIGFFLVRDAYGKETFISPREISYGVADKISGLDFSCPDIKEPQIDPQLYETEEVLDVPDYVEI